MAVDWDLVQRCLQQTEFLLRQGDIPGPQVFQNALLVFGARNGHHIGIFVQHPTQRNLGRSGILFLRVTIQQIQNGLIGLQILTAQLGHKFAHIVTVGKIRPCCHLETGSFSKAAKALNYTQSGISQMMAALEEELGVTISQELVMAVFSRPGLVSRPLSPVCCRTIGLAFSKAPSSVVSKMLLSFLQEQEK